MNKKEQNTAFSFMPQNLQMTINHHIYVCNTQMPYAPPSTSKSKTDISPPHPPTQKSLMHTVFMTYNNHSPGCRSRDWNLRSSPERGSLLTPKATLSPSDWVCIQLSGSQTFFSPPVFLILLQRKKSPASVHTSQLKFDLCVHNLVN